MACDCCAFQVVFQDQTAQIEAAANGYAVGQPLVPLTCQSYEIEEQEEKKFVKQDTAGVQQFLTGSIQIVAVWAGHCKDE